MKLIYTHDNRFRVLNARNILANAGIETVLINEHLVTGMGELSPFDIWLEVHVTNDADLTRAKDLIASRFDSMASRDWFCSNCHENNDASFEVCWNCQSDAAKTQ